MKDTIHAQIIRRHGGPDVLEPTEVPTPIPGTGEVVVRNAAIGINFVDTQHRAGQPYPVRLPLIPGVEGAGTIAAVGADVVEFAVSDRVAYAGYMGGAYAEYSAIPVARLIPIPESVSFEQAAASLLQGMTAHVLTHRAYRVQPGDVALVHGAAGGVGLFLVQMARRCGATVIGTVSSEAKARVAQSMGADHIIQYREADFQTETLRLTVGRGVHVVYDSVGRETFDKNINVLGARGHLVIFGLSSGNIPPFDINRLSGITGAGNKGSLSITWPTLNDYAAERADLLWHANSVLDWVGDGTLTVHVAAKLPLSQAAEAHRLLEGRQVAGKVLLLP
ncbi:MAG: quinone oxidoreductase family protein [Anaerolineales bacterium]